MSKVQCPKSRVRRALLFDALLCLIGLLILTLDFGHWTLDFAEVFAQESQSQCPNIAYSARLSNPHTYRLKGIEGQAVYGGVSEKGEFVWASAVCVYLFDKKDKHLVASVLTSNDGHFNFANTASGNYVLQVAVGALHEIAIPVEVAHDQSADHNRAGGQRLRSFKPWQLLLHLRSREDRKKSFVTAITQPALRAELLKLVERDQAIRNERIQSGSDKPNQEIDVRMDVIDAESTGRMKAIVRRYGWPGPGLVGRDGADGAFILVQHSRDLAFERAMLPLVRRSYERGDLSAWNYALLVDRVLTREGKPQMYGMSLKPWTGKEPVLFPILDETNVDRRRAKLGLSPLREYLEFMKRLYFPSQ